jgi:hypothetical protein
MRRRRRRRRSKRVRVRPIVIFGLLILLLVPFAVVQIPQYVMRYRAAQLLSDFQKMSLHETSWSDAQILMERWSKWGHTDGPCTEQDCQYEVILDSAAGRFFASRSPLTMARMQRYGVVRLYHLFGGREAKLLARFIVQDGTIWRNSVAITIAVPSSGGDDPGYSLIVEAKASQSLHHDPHVEWVLGGDDQIASHPYYKAGRPSLCTYCMMAMITYGIHTPAEEVERLTAFDLSCLTRFRPCRQIEDILLAAVDWHLYDAMKLGYTPPQPHPGRATLWTLGRDVRAVLVVDALPSSGPPLTPDSLAKVQVVEVLKGDVPWKPGATLEIKPFSGYAPIGAPQSPEHIVPGNRFVIMLDPDNSGHLDLTQPPLRILEDTQQLRRALQKGFDENDNLRRPELP